MNKAVPWNVKGVGFDTREAARVAAKRAGLSVGQWLDTVITDRANELGVTVSEVSSSERLDALVARLAGVADSAQRSDDRQGEDSLHRTATARRPVDVAVRQEPALEDEADMQNGIVKTVRRVANGADYVFDSAPPRASGARTGSAKRNDSMSDWDKDALLDQALLLVQQRSREAAEKTIGEAQRQAVAALSREVGRLGDSDDHAPPLHKQPIAAFEDRLAGWESRIMQSGKSAASRPVSAAVGSVAERLEQIEGRMAQRNADLATRPIVSALSRLEERFETLAKRNMDGSREAARAEATLRDLDQRLTEIANKIDGRDTSAPFKSQAEIERIDGKLASILARLDRDGRAVEAERPIGKGDTPADGAGRLPERKHLRDTIADIAQRQADLEQAPGHRAGLLSEASYPSIGQAQREGRRPGVASAGAADPAGFETLQTAFTGLAHRLDGGSEGAVGANDDLRVLKTGIAGLEQRLDAMQQHNLQRTEDGAFVALRQEIAALSQGLADFAAQQSASTLDQIVRTMNERVEVSRLDGVSDTVLAPVARLNADLLDVLRNNDPRDMLGDLQRQVATIGTKMERIESREIDADEFAGMREDTRAMHALLKAAVEKFVAGDRLEQEFATLGARIDKLADTPPRAALRELELATNDIRTMLVRLSPTGTLQELSHKLDRLADRFADAEDRMALPAALFDDLTRRIDEAHASLAERIAAKPPVDLRPIEAMIGGLSGKIDGLRHTTTDVQALGGLVRGLAAQIEEAQLPNADAKALDLLESQVGRLAERLDHSDASLTAIASLERLIGELFHQVEETRTATIEAAESAARNAAQDALRASTGAAVDNADPRDSLVAEKVSQELSEMRQAQHASEKRVHSTLLALNETLERMVERLLKDGQASPPKARATEPAPLAAAVAPKPEPGRRAAVAPVAVAPAVPVGVAGGTIDPETPVSESEVKRSPTMPKATAPTIEIGRAIPGEPTPDVSPLIAAARRAAQAAQVSAQSTSREKLGKSRVTISDAAPTSKSVFGFLGRKRRQLLLGLAGVVLLLGALEMVQLTKRGASNVEVATNSLPVNTDAVTKSDAPPDPVTSEKSSTSALMPGSNVAPPAPPVAAVAASPAPVPAPSIQAAKVDAALVGLPAGLMALATGGDANAQYEVGIRLSEGRGVTRDLKAAATWFERAAKQGLAPAQYRLGSLFEKGIGVSADAAQAVTWYERAANQGNVRAMHNLAVMSAEAGSGKPDYAKAATWFEKAASFGVRDSQFNLAILEARGLGIPQDLPQAYTWFSVAAGQGDADAGKKRDDVAGKLDAKQLAAAKAATDAFKPATPDRAANDVVAPPGGWDAVVPNASSAKELGKAKVSSM